MYQSSVKQTRDFKQSLARLKMVKQSTMWVTQPSDDVSTGKQTNKWEGKVNAHVHKSSMSVASLAPRAWLYANHHRYKDPPYGTVLAHRASGQPASLIFHLWQRMALKREGEEPGLRSLSRCCATERLIETYHVGLQLGVKSSQNW